MSQSSAIYTSLVIKAIPYLAALVLTIAEVPSRLLAFRHRRHTSKQKIDFAYRWSKVAETAGYPFLVLVYALSQVAELIRDNQTTAITAGWLLVGGGVYAGLVFMALFFFCGDLEDEHALPSFRSGKGMEVSFDKLVVGTKVVGVLFPGVLDLWLTARSLAALNVGSH